MAKLRGQKKAEFLARMARGRKKSRSNPLTGVPSRDIPRLMREGRSQKQAEAIALSEQRRHARGKRKTKLLKKEVMALKRRRNQEPGSLKEAQKQFERFHGKPPGRIVEVTEQLRYPEHFAELGKLVELRIFLDAANPAFGFTGFGRCQVVSTPDGSNIYFIEGDQSIDLRALDIDTDKDFVELGPCIYIAYHTIKGFHDFEPTTYWHEFGEEDEIFPVLGYDTLNKKMFLIGGNYRVRPEGIVN